MYYVTKNYITEEFASEEDAYNYIIADLESHHLSYKKVYEQTDNDIQVIVFQYHTLYMEAYIIHKTMDLRTRRN
ncbi:MAG: hypothetical protein EOM87_06675 [Clostridia bacterium]|nr:hypothetical protein [Clostridia bacterium]